MSTSLRARCKSFHMPIYSTPALLPRPGKKARRSLPKTNSLPEKPLSRFSGRYVLASGFHPAMYVRGAIYGVRPEFFDNLARILGFGIHDQMGPIRRLAANLFG